MKRVIFYGILIFIVSIGIGYYYSSLWKNGNEGVAYQNNSKEEGVTETVSTEEKVAYNATFGIKKYYNECGHFKFQYSELPKELVNLSKTEIENLYADWNVEEFNSNNIVLSKKIDGFCDEHYILKLGEDNIEIYRAIGEGKTKFYKSTNISKEYLTSTDINNLTEGIYVYGSGNLNSAIEDFE